VVEVKSTLDMSELRDVADKIAAAKALKKSPAPDLPFLVNTNTLGCVFAFRSAVSLGTLAASFESILKAQELLGRHIDVIVVLDVGAVTLVSEPPGTSTWAPALIEGPGGRASEGMHIGVGHQALGADSVDFFFRILLMHLSYFRGIVDHPGFSFQNLASGGQALISYLTTITYEKDPKRREERLRKYRERVKAEFAGGTPGRTTNA
jgi:hypothetical protein